MLQIVTDNERVVYAGDRWSGAGNPPAGEVVNRWHIKSLGEAQTWAERCTCDLAPRRFFAADNGPNVSPRFEVIEAFKLGEPVGYGFNGDRYADGTITHISDSGRVIKTSTGNQYFRRGRTAQWRKAGGTWTLSRGHHETRNPDL